MKFELVAIDKADERPPYRQIAAGLREAIQRGALGPGDRLPSESELVERYGVARMTVRQAAASGYALAPAPLRERAGRLARDMMARLVQSVLVPVPSPPMSLTGQPVRIKPAAHKPPGSAR